MSDEPRTFAPETVDVQDEAALKDWAQRLAASPDDVRAAVQAVGPNATAVELWLDAPSA